MAQGGKNVNLVYRSYIKSSQCQFLWDNGLYAQPHCILKFRQLIYFPFPLLDTLINPGVELIIRHNKKQRAHLD